MEKNNGFTLVELLSVIVILAIILLIAVPNILDVINRSKRETFEISVKKAFDAVNYKIMLDQDIVSGDLNNLETLESTDLKGTWKYENKEIYLCNINNGIYKVKGDNEGCFKESDIVIIKNDDSGDTNLVNLDTTGANSPDILDNMIPVRWNGTSWIKADVNNKDENNKWYDYNEKMWANSVTVTDVSRSNYLSSDVGTVINMNDIVQMYVWIPRYKYTILNNYHSNIVGNFGIEFENEKETTGTIDLVTPCTNGTYCTHPAFISFNSRGLWVGKFESGNDKENVLIKPGENAINNINASEMFETAMNINNLNNNSGFDTDNSVVDPHMMKNTEWGAVLYLTFSNYGKNEKLWINNNDFHLTGCSADPDINEHTESCVSYETEQGNKASTTGNIYGIYDMRGGSYEYMAANFGISSTDSNSKIIENINSKYVDNLNGEFSLENTKGMALYETSIPKSEVGYNKNKSNNLSLLNCKVKSNKINMLINRFRKERIVPMAGVFSTEYLLWGDYSFYFVDSNNPLMGRGETLYSGDHGNVFSANRDNGSNYGAYSFRVVLSF